MARPPTALSHALTVDSTAFQDSVKAFKREVPPHVVQQFEHINSLKDLNIAIRDIERQQAASKSLRNLRKIEPFLKVLNEYAPIIDTFANAKPDVLSLIWGPIKFCLQVQMLVPHYKNVTNERKAACKYSKAFDSLLSAYRKIQDALPSISTIEKLFSSHDIVPIILQRVYTDILVFHQRAVLFFSKPGWKMVLQSTCRTLEDSFGDVLENLRDSKQLLYTSADVASYLDAQKGRTHVEQAFLEQQTRERHARKITVQSWLNATPHKNQHLELQALRAKYPDTCGWLFKDRAWLGWMAGNTTGRQAFWISGIPGAGKTVLFSAMVDEIRSRTKRTADHSITVYLYCKYNDNTRDNFVALTRSLINSLLEGNELCYDYLYDVAVNSNEQFATTTDILSNTVLNLLQFYDHTYIGIDGLDEVEPAERTMLTKLLLQMTDLTDEDHLPHIFLTGRAEIDIEKSFEGVDRFRLEASHVTGDIHRYVLARAHELDIFQVDQCMLDNLVTATVDRSAGMFLLAKLIFDMFELCVNKEDFEFELHNHDLPKGIEEAYRRILLRIQKRDQLSRHPRAARLLEILAFARRTLYLHEVQAALSINIRRCDIDIRNRRYTQHFKEICGSIVEVNSDGTVVLVHATAKQYLAQGDHNIFSVPDAQGRFADTCVTYLSMEIFDFDSDRTALESAASNGYFGFHRYAFCNWLPHISQAAKSQQLTLGDFCSTRNISGVFRNGFPIDLDSENVPCSMDLPNDSSGLSQRRVFAVLGMLDAINTGDSSVNVEHEFFHIALGHANKVQKLIEQLISKSSDEDSRKFLRVTYGDSPYMCNKIECPRFHKGFSSAADRESHVKTHLRPHKCSVSDCEFNRTGFATGSALKNHIHLFHFEDLSLRFARLETRSFKQRLIDATDRNDPETIELLYQKNSKGKFTNSELRDLVLTAMNKESTEAACALIKNLKSVNALSEPLRNLGPKATLLTEAAFRGNARVLQTLIHQYLVASRGTHGGIVFLNFKTALTYCIEHKLFDSLRVMLNVWQFRQTLHINHQPMPVSSDLSMILSLVVSKGSDQVNSLIDGPSLLLNSIDDNDITLARALLAAGVAINHQPNFGCSPVCFSAVSGNIEILQLLIDYGADINLCAFHRSVDKSTPLHQAVKHWLKPSMQCLLENKADHLIVDFNGNTAFNTKISKWNMSPLGVCLRNVTGPALISGIKQLIDMGAKCNPRGGTKHVPTIHQLAFNATKDLYILSKALELMRANGADLDSVDHTGQSGRQLFTEHKRELLEFAGIALWSSPTQSENASNIEGNWPDLQFKAEIVLDDQATSSSSGQAGENDFGAPFADLDLIPEVASSLHMAPDKAPYNEDDSAISGMNTPSHLQAVQSYETGSTNDSLADELNLNPWAQEESRAAGGDNDETSRSYQYSLMQEWF